MIKPLTIDNLSPTLRHLRWKMNYSDNSYRVFPPKWGWFTRAHYLLLRKFRSRSLNYLQMTWFPLQWVKQNIRRFDLVNSILPNIYFLEIALNTSASPFVNSDISCRVNVERWGFEVVMCNPPCYLFYCVPGSVTLDELMTGLMSAHETFQQAMDIEIREEVNRR